MTDNKKNTMDAGEVELRKAFEEVTTRNVKMVVDYTKKTREIVRELEREVEKQNKQIRLYDTKFEELRKQLAVLQAKLYAGGSS